MAVSLALIAGARPNFMKIAPLVHALSGDADFDPILVHTGQHYDDNMSGQFFRDLDIPPPRYHLEVGSGSHAQQTAEIMKRLEPVLLETRAAGLIVVGDVNSTVAGALVAAKLGIKVVHVEAGLRSFDRSMPEEINRIVTDSISDLLLITEESGRANLLREGIAAERIHAVGNLMIDSLKKNLARALESDVVERLQLPQRYGLVTLHRPANVDDSRQLGEILGALEAIGGEVPLIWPMHPRTKARIESNGVRLPNQLRFTDPLGYLDFLCLQAKSAVVLTDSGGIQEETTVLGVPCLTLRDNTERPVTVEHGTNRLAGTKKQTILAAWENCKTNPRTGLQPPLWDGQAGLRCRAVLRQFFLSDAVRTS
ncbi:MAG: UDP-N-acetylglucosamine 2-epimerase (non-hydrolyzing) [Bryobacterales bacterium]|nr:UDP-N-acetylglucosamine 2-epimerase (non-hydrolyzing) [Bryobacterales bacterium]